MQKFLVCLDYDTGGIWRAVLADSASTIKEKYPELEVELRKPEWMSDDMYDDIMDHAIDLDNSNNKLFKTILSLRSE
ncbi:hypothetical protein VT06_15585 [Arsukibacterium sp. MJ3]|uniref:hypothetical protein n=1 Tax=Arsukibacterium sp. MJ3 TaxID=1632859 RepID=UPI0006270F7B|nr:hypothetical protein [Arsukibacterium sp. MJ3]KKO47735.1 hypothetical protein VT06_15585 [Arsukibacterium sp. MJ3]